LQRKPSKQKKEVFAQKGMFLPGAGSLVYTHLEFMIIVSDGDPHPPNVEVSRRLPAKNESLKIKSTRRPPTFFEGLSHSANLDLNIVADMIALSSLKELKSLALDVKGEERSKAYYLDAIARFIEHCQTSGGEDKCIGCLDCMHSCAPVNQSVKYSLTFDMLAEVHCLIPSPSP
jgi:ferredoxin